MSSDGETERREGLIRESSLKGVTERTSADTGATEKGRGQSRLGAGSEGGAPMERPRCTERGGLPD